STAASSAWRCSEPAWLEAPEGGSSLEFDPLPRLGTEPLNNKGPTRVHLASLRAGGTRGQWRHRIEPAQSAADRADVRGAVLHHDPAADEAPKGTQGHGRGARQ